MKIEYDEEIWALYVYILEICEEPLSTYCLEPSCIFGEVNFDFLSNWDLFWIECLNSKILNINDLSSVKYVKKWNRHIISFSNNDIIWEYCNESSFYDWTEYFWKIKILYDKNNKIVSIEVST